MESKTNSEQSKAPLRTRGVVCPFCGEKTQPKAYGPFFTPEPCHRYAMTCPHDHWRGRMCATRQEAEGDQTGR